MVPTPSGEIRSNVPLIPTTPDGQVVGKTSRRLAIDLKFVQVIVIPIEGPLDHGVQPRQRQRTRHQPDIWLDVAQTNPELEHTA